jgi:hypothetical protein
MRLTFLFSILIATTSCFTQSANKANSADQVITSKEALRIETILSSDSMEGRKTGTPGIDKAATFISNEFKKVGLKTFNNEQDYRQAFTMVKPKQVSFSGMLDGIALDPKNVVVFTSATELKVDNKAGYKKVYIKPGANLVREALEIIGQKENRIIVVDTSFSKSFPILLRVKRTLFKSPNNFIFVLTQTDPAVYNITATHEFEEQQLANVVGVLPGKSKKNEYVIFSGHYDHLGIGKPANGDSIFNGANDDAAGTTAVIMLARYYKALGNNERTLIFTTFTAEEIGGFGSQYFSRQLDPNKVVAMFNIEMIGTESKWGKASAYITGYEKTNMGSILEKNLAGSSFKFYPDPYTDQQLFYRSDNATLARLGVPAHTISTSKMDNEPNYHKVTDEIGTLDMVNMAEIIKAIATSARSIVGGVDTPSRVKVDELR